MNDQSIILNADDLGISIGTNKTIEKMIKLNKLNSVSIFVNQKYTEEGIEMIKKYKNVNIGLHFNLTIAKSCLGHRKLPNLTDQNGNFKNGFLKLFIIGLFRKNELEKEVELELNAQLEYLKSKGIKVSHIDGHRHIHSIPFIFNKVFGIAKKNKIKRIRIINENLLHTMKTTKNFSFLFNGNILKFLILKIFTIINSSRNKIKTDIYFFSILHSCKINKTMIKKFTIPENFKSAEIMLHPGDPDIDKKDLTIKYEKKHLISKDRKIESEAI